jgi:hypothetical protein
LISEIDKKNIEIKKYENPELKEEVTEEKKQKKTDRIEESKRKIEELKNKKDEELKKFFEGATYLNPNTYDEPDKKDIGTKEEVWKGTKKYYESRTRSGYKEYRTRDLLIQTRTGIVDMLKSVKNPKFNAIYKTLPFTDETTEEVKEEVKEEKSRSPPGPPPGRPPRRKQGPPPGPPPIPPPPPLEEKKTRRKLPKGTTPGPPPPKKAPLKTSIIDEEGGRERKKVDTPPDTPEEEEKPFEREIMMVRGGESKKLKPHQIPPPGRPSQAPLPGQPKRRQLPKGTTPGPPKKRKQELEARILKEPPKRLPPPGQPSQAPIPKTKIKQTKIKPDDKKEDIQGKIYSSDDLEEAGIDMKHDLENVQQQFDEQDIMFEQPRSRTDFKYNDTFFDNRPSISNAPSNVRSENLNEFLNNNQERKEEKEIKDANYYEVLRERIKNQQNKEAAAREAYYNGMSYSLQQEHYDEKTLEEKKEEFMRNVRETERLLQEFLDFDEENERDGLDAEYDYLNEEGREEPRESRWSRFRQNLRNNQQRSYNLQAIQQYMRENAIRSRARISELSSSSIANIAEGLGVVNSSIQDFSNRYGLQLELFNELREWGAINSILGHPLLQNTMMGRGLSELNQQTIGKGNLTQLQTKFSSIMDAIMSGGKVITGSGDLSDILKISKGGRSAVDIGKGVKSIVDTMRETKDDDKEGKDDDKDDKKDLISELQDKGIIYQKLTKPAAIGKPITPYKFPSPYERNNANKLIQNAVNNFLLDRNMYGNYYGNDI